MNRMRPFLIAALLALPVAAAAQDFTVTPLNPVRVGKVGEQIKVKTLVTNHSAETIRLRVDRVEEIPDGWTSSICFGIFCLADFVSSAEENWGPGETDTLSTWINAIEGEGYGLVTYNVTQRDTNGAVVGDTIVQKYLGITDGLDLLVVDQSSDGSGAAEITSRIPAGKSYGVWSVFDKGPQFDDLTAFDYVFWTAGDRAEPLSDANRSSIARYLGDGGKLFLSGSNLAYGLCDPSSSRFSEEACQFYANEIGAAYVGASNVETSVAGITGDGLGRDLAFTVDDPASDRIAPTTAGRSFLAWASGGSAGIRIADGPRRLIHLPFAFASIADAGAADELIARAFAFFDDVTAPQLAIGVLQHPFFTTDLDFYVASADGVEPESVELLVNDGSVALDMLDAGAGIWHARYTLDAPGEITLEASAEDVSSNAGDVSRSFSASKASAGAFSVASRDGGFRVDLEAGRFENGDYVLVLSGDGAHEAFGTRAAGKGLPGVHWTGNAEAAANVSLEADAASAREAPAEYVVSPARTFDANAAHVTFRSGGHSMEEEADEVVVHDGVPLETYFDGDRNEYTASAPALGVFKLEARDGRSAVPADPSFVALGPNTPNPFNPTTTIRFELRARQFVSLVIYDAAGRAVRTLASGEFAPGERHVVWNGESDDGRPVASGVYFARISADRASETRKLTLIR